MPCEKQAGQLRLWMHDEPSRTDDRGAGQLPFWREEKYLCIQTETNGFEEAEVDGDGWLKRLEESWRGDDVRELRRCGPVVKAVYDSPYGSGERFNARCGSLVMDEMSIKEASIYHKQFDAVHGPGEPAGGAEADYGLENELATHLLCFVFVGLLTHYSLRSSTLALIAGFLVRAIQDNIECEGCLVKLQAPSSGSQTTALIAGVHRGGLSYPTLPFVGLVHYLEQAASRVASVLVKGPQPCKKFLGRCAAFTSEEPTF
ncbi:hypothetical protein HPB48_026532 [Haemaphysalis longicornis]|uniref:Transposable element P transposase-like RNase H domain-containing protein n=1 Tax=Haemaphysalis longicornis TaxID=44386 RepID=A0A9J6HB00_HAELO|nr:hypothetical protein HPB48_026532 [Haemaphysalis longicornis]